MPIPVRKYSDLDFNFIANPLSGDVSKLTGTAAVKAAVKNLVLTNHFERPFHPEIGSGVTGLLFDNKTPFTASYIQRNIEDVLKNFEPRATLQDLKINVDSDPNGVSVSITFFVNNIPEPITIDFFLQRTR